MQKDKPKRPIPQISRNYRLQCMVARHTFKSHQTNGATPMTKILAKHGYEVWMSYDHTAGVYELFASSEGSDYIGCADTRQEALKIANNWIRERRLNG
jgi:hypothetical protein